MGNVNFFKIPENCRLLLDLDMSGGKLVIRYNQRVVFKQIFSHKEKLSLEPLLPHPSRGILDIVAEDSSGFKLPESVRLLVVSKDLQNIQLCQTCVFRKDEKRNNNHFEEISFKLIAE